MPRPGSGGSGRAPFVPRTDKLLGFVYDVATGRLREVG
jgi:hypothetical protein